MSRCFPLQALAGVRGDDKNERGRGEREREREREKRGERRGEEKRRVGVCGCWLLQCKKERRYFACSPYPAVAAVAVVDGEGDDGDDETKPTRPGGRTVPPPQPHVTCSRLECMGTTGLPLSAPLMGSAVPRAPSTLAMIL